MIKNRVDFKGFYENELHLEQEERKSTKSFFKQSIFKNIFLFLFSGLFISILLSKVFPDMGINITGLFLAAFLLYIIGAIVVTPVIMLIGTIKGIKEIKEKLFTGRKEKAPILNKILGQVLPGFRYEPKNMITLEEFDNIGLLSLEYHPAYAYGDIIVGKYKGISVRISESNPMHQEMAKQEVIRHRGEMRPAEKPVYLGTLLEFYIEEDPNFKLQVVDNEVTEHQYVVGNLKKNQGMEKISLTNTFFDENYRVKTNDVFKTRKMMEPRHVASLVETIKDLGSKTSFTYVDGKLVIYIEDTKNLFEGIKEGEATADQVWDDLMELVSLLKLYDKFSIGK